MSSPTPDATSSEPGSALQFVLGAVVVAGGLGLLAAQAPARIRLVGLFSLGLGLLTGWLLTSLAGRLNVRLDAAKIAVIGIVTLGGLVTSVCATVAQQPPPPPVRDMHPIEAQVMARMRKAAESSGSEAPDPAGPTISVLPAIPRIDVTPAPPTGFASRVRTYLQRRVEMLGDWISPWPELFWGGELLAATAGSVWMASRSRRGESAS